jgi:hypothetical protein
VAHSAAPHPQGNARIAGSTFAARHFQVRKPMSRLVIVVEKTSDWGSYYPSDNVVSAQDYLKQPLSDDDERTQVINLCRS